MLTGEAARLSCAKAFMSFIVSIEVIRIEFKKFYNYDVYEDGRVYSHYKNRFLKYDLVQGYVQYTLFIDKKPYKYKAHRLVAMLFLDPPSLEEDIIINHKDGNKLNNHYSNLKWCDYYHNNKHARDNNLNNISKSNSERWKDKGFRDRTSKHISEGRRRTHCSEGKNNVRFRYEIYDDSGREYTRKELASMLGLSQSYTDGLIRKAANGINNDHFKLKHIIVKDIKKQS